MTLLLIPVVILATFLFIFLGPARRIGTEPARPLISVSPECLDGECDRCSFNRCWCECHSIDPLPVAGRLSTYQPTPNAYGHPFTETGPLFHASELAAAHADLERYVARITREAEAAIPPRWRS